MERWDMEKRREVAIIDLDALVPENHLLRKIERVMDYEWIYERLEPFYCHVSYVFCKRFPPELAEEIFAHILNKAINNRMAKIPAKRRGFFIG